MKSHSLKANSQQLLGIGFGALAIFNSPEVAHTSSKLAVGIGTGALVWLFSKAAGKIVGRAYRKEMRENTEQSKIAQEQLKKAHQGLSPPPARGPGQRQATKTPQRSGIYKLSPSEAEPILRHMRVAAKITLAISLTQAAAAYCAYHYGRPYIAKETTTLSAKLAHH